MVDQGLGIDLLFMFILVKSIGYVWTILETQLLSLKSLLFLMV
jgi:hypothetical protein